MYTTSQQICSVTYSVYFWVKIYAQITHIHTLSGLTNISLWSYQCFGSSFPCTPSVKVMRSWCVFIKVWCVQCQLQLSHIDYYVVYRNYSWTSLVWGRSDQAKTEKQDIEISKSLLKIKNDLGSHLQDKNSSSGIQ